MRHKTLVTADTSEPLKGGVDRAAALLPDAEMRILDDDHSASRRQQKAALM
jgi:hypothetical protein